MNIVQITPGAGGMYCGGCFRDNALVAALRRAGHDTLMVPLYLPLTLDEPDQSAATPIFFSGINVYLEQKSTLFRRAPAWLHRLLASRSLLKWAAGKAAKTRAEDVGELMLSMIRGEEGNQARELDELIAWLKAHARPDVVCLSNALLIGMARKLKADLKVPIACLLSGEDTFLDGLPPKFRETAWSVLAQRCQDVDVFISPSRYFAELMQRRLGLPDSRVRVVPNGINLNGYPTRNAGDGRKSGSPVLGYFARMCPEKGLDTLVDAFVLLKQREGTRSLRLHVGGGCGPGDEAFVALQKRKLDRAGVAGEARWFPNVTHAEKLAFLSDLTVFSTPALYGEAFGLYVIEALAAGVPVVQPRHGGFPEIVESTGGGVLCEPGDATKLADAIETLLSQPGRLEKLGQAGRAAVQSNFTIERMAERFVEALKLKTAPVR